MHHHINQAGGQGLRRHLTEEAAAGNHPRAALFRQACKAQPFDATDRLLADANKGRAPPVYLRRQ